MIPFSPPNIDQKVIDEVTEALRSGWITTGPRTKKFEKLLTAYCGSQATLCLNSATAGLEIMLRWFGVGPGDEVILPAYTYSATANVIVHCGATPVFVDVNAEDFNISAPAIEAAITSKTKVIMPVDFGGYPCDYRVINSIAANAAEIFIPATPEQEALGRPLVLSDSAHSFGAWYHGERAGSLTDVSVFSFHAVKNLTTAEGGAIALNLPSPFDNERIYRSLCVKTLHGQDKDALAKTQKGNWKYDIVEAGYKCNMTDIVAAIGLVELDRYDSEILPARRAICEQYDRAFQRYAWAELPVSQTAELTSCYHLYPLRINDISEKQRDAIIREIFEKNVAVNVHFIPVPMMSFYKGLGYDITPFPVTYSNYSREISLPVYVGLDEQKVQQVIDAVEQSVHKVMGYWPFRK